MAISTETQRLRERYQHKLDNSDWTEADLRILETAIADRLQIELPGKQIPLYPNFTEPTIDAETETETGETPNG